jgi:hypothetical protein
MVTSNKLNIEDRWGFDVIFFFGFFVCFLFFFFFFFLCPFCILPVCLGAPFTLFNNILFITYQKKKISTSSIFLIVLIVGSLFFIFG